MGSFLHNGCRLGLAHNPIPPCILLRRHCWICSPCSSSRSWSDLFGPVWSCVECGFWQTRTPSDDSKGNTLFSRTFWSSFCVGKCDSVYGENYIP
jgi:hypothetical protein